jgi:hypothetical protein
MRNRERSGKTKKYESLCNQSESNDESKENEEHGFFFVLTYGEMSQLWKNGS